MHAENHLPGPCLVLDAERGEIFVKPLLVAVQLLEDFFFSSRRRHTRCLSDWSSDVCSSDLSSMTTPSGPMPTTGPSLPTCSRSCRPMPWKPVSEAPTESVNSVFGKAASHRFFTEIGRASCRERVMISVGAN